MIAAIPPHPEQVRYYAQSALNGFDTLDHNQAVQNAKDELTGLLAYLGRFADYSVPIFGKSQIEPYIRFEGQISNPQIDDLADFKSVRAEL